MILRFPRYKDEEKHVWDKKLFNAVLEKINKQFKGESGASTVTTLGDSVFSQPRGYVSSGILPVDCVVCFGLGFPVGIIEIYGPEASLKTGIMEATLVESQRRGYYTGLFPTEYSLDYRRIKIVGLDTDKLIIAEVETIEDVYDRIRSMVKEIRKEDKDTPIVFGWDSVAATPTRSELDQKEGLDKSDMGKSGLQMSKLFRRLVRFLFVNKVCLICINQTRTNLAKRFGDKDSTFGGRALRFYAWVRCKMYRIKTLRNKEDEKIGYLMELTVVKNKVAAPERSCKIPIYFDRGIDKIGAIWEYVIDKGIVQRKGTSYRWHHKVVTRKSFYKLYRKYQEEIDAACRKATLVRANGNENISNL